MNFKRISTHVLKFLSELQLRKLLFSIAAFWLFCIVFIWFFRDLFAGAILAVTIVTFVAVAVEFHVQYKRDLSARIAAANSTIWHVEINQVKAGTVTDADFARICLCIFADFRLYIAQVANLLRVALNWFAFCSWLIPLWLFWGGIALAIFSPEAVNAVVSALQRATPSDIRHTVTSGISFLTIMMILMACVHWVLGLSSFGFINRFDEAIATAVRKHCGVAAEGSVTMQRWADGSPVCLEEVSFFRGWGTH